MNPQADPVSSISMPPASGGALSDEELDQEWVNKARDIVEQTKSDPFTQSNELHKVRAGYMKARFNKELNVGSDQTSQ